MKNCTDCGMKIPENVKCCPVCGADQPTDETGMSTTAAPYIKPELFSFSGRARRSDYWIFQLVSFLVNLPFILYFSDWIAECFETFFARGSLPEYPSSGWILLWFLITIPLFFWGLSVQVRRCHDLGWSGWFLLGAAILSALPGVGWLINLAFWIALGFVDGQSGPNRFGPDPKGRPAPSRDGTVL